ncbi:ATP-dependent DNA ligase [Candidatus Woesearchaeota archaeon]|nr:ATP-dependent DNA ligase [Candidatus Woesearchaeota archaeon]
MRYLELVELFEALSKTTKRLEKTKLIADFIKKIRIEEIDNTMCLLTASIFPPYDKRKIGVSDRLILKAISKSTGIKAEEVEKLWSKIGDLGDVGEKLLKEKLQKTLEVEVLTTNKVLANLRKLAELEGEGTVDKKINLIAELLANSKPNEAKFILRTILGELRVGIAEGVIRDAFAQAYNVEIKDIKKGMDLALDYSEIVKLAKQGSFKLVKIKVGRPLKVMLAILAADIDEGFEALGKPMQLEFKLDGFRVTIHKLGNNIKLFTRRLEDVSKQFPDVIDVVKKNIKGDNYVIDAEVVAYSPKTKKYLPFQTISQRIKRKYDILELAKKFPVELDVFDVLYHEGESYLDTSLKERRKLLTKIIKEKPGSIILTKCLITDDLGKAKEFYHEALSKGLEGIMMKNLNSLYKPGRYVEGWMKLKPILEPLDLVIVGAEYGEGKRASWLTSYTIACSSKEGLKIVGKVSTGVKEKDSEVTYESMTKILKPLIISQEGKSVKLKPKIVIEVGYEEIQVSQTYDSGFALRFPKFMRLRTFEKTIKDINTLEDVKRIYEKQKGKK